MERDLEPVRAADSPTSPHMAVAMILNRSLTPDEMDRLEEEVSSGVTSVTALATTVEPDRRFLPWEEIVLDMTFRPLLAHPCAPEGD